MVCEVDPFDPFDELVSVFPRWSFKSLSEPFSSENLLVSALELLIITNLAMSDCWLWRRVEGCVDCGEFEVERSTCPGSQIKGIAPLSRKRGSR